MSLISGLGSTVVHSVLGISPPLSAARTPRPTNLAANPVDRGRVSPFGELVGSLQQLQQTNLLRFQKVAQQVAGDLNKSASSAQAAGNAAAAVQLGQLASDFTSAAISGQMPNLQDLATAFRATHPTSSSVDPFAIIQTALARAK